MKRIFAISLALVVVVVLYAEYGQITAEEKPKTWSVKFQFIDDSGAPITNADCSRVHISDSSIGAELNFAWQEFKKGQQTDANGFYELELPENFAESDSFDIVMPVGYYPQDECIQLVKSMNKVQKSDSNIVIIKCKKELTLAGNVSTPTGKPCSGAELILLPDFSTLDGSGWYYMKHDPIDGYSMNTIKHALASQSARATIDGERMPDEEAYFDDSYFPYVVEADDAGKFEISGLVPGRYTIIAHDKAGGYFIKNIVAPASELSLKVELATAPTGTLKINLKGDTQEESIIEVVPGGARLNNNPLTLSWSAAPDNEEPLSIERVPTGWQYIRPLRGPGLFVYIEEGKAAEVTLCLDSWGWGKLDFQARLAEELLKDYAVDIYQEGCPFKSPHTDDFNEDDRELQLQPGKYGLCISDYWTKDIEVGAGSEQAVVAEFKPVRLEVTVPKFDIDAGGEGSVEFFGIDNTIRMYNSTYDQLGRHRLLEGKTNVELPPFRVRYEVEFPRYSFGGVLDLTEWKGYSIELGTEHKENIVERRIQFANEIENGNSQGYSLNHIGKINRSVNYFFFEEPVLEDDNRTGTVLIDQSGPCTYQLFFPEHGSPIVGISKDELLKIDQDNYRGVRFKIPEGHSGLEVRLIDSRGWIWQTGARGAQYWKRKNYAIEFSATPGKARMAIERDVYLANADTYRRELAIVDIDVSEKLRETKLEEIPFSTDSYGELEVVINGLGSDTMLSSKLWYSEITGSGRDGIWDMAAAVLVDVIEPLGLTTPKKVSDHYFITIGGYSRTTTVKELVPGTYRVTPWQGAPDEYVNEVVIEAGKTKELVIDLK